MNKFIVIALSSVFSMGAYASSALPINAQKTVSMHSIIDAPTTAWSSEIIVEPDILPIIPEKPFFKVTQTVEDKDVITDYTVSSDLLFAFDKYTVKKQDERVIDNIVDHIKENYYSISRISVTGHTDRLGKDSYNLNLSMRRADAVKNLLIERGIHEGLIDMQGLGESSPVTNGCYGIKKREAVKACLQPDRRVEIKVIGQTKMKQIQE